MLLGLSLAFAAERPVVYGYHAYWTDEPATLDFDSLTHVAIFNVDVETDGSLSSTSHWTGVAEDVVAAAHAQGVKVHLCVTAFYDSEHDAVFGSSEVRSRLIDELAELVHAYGADGVNVDFEGLSSAYREDMVDFVVDLRAEVGEVVLATPAIDWSGAWDYSALSDVSDGLFIMGYGYHWTGGNPGPNDPLYGGDPWSDYSLDWTVDDYLAYDADPAKVILGLPLYGQAWEANHEVPGSAYDEGWSITMVDAMAEAEIEGALYDDVTRSPYYLPSGQQVWYPDHDSVRERIEYAVDREIGGVGFWALDYEGRDPAFWAMVDEAATWPVPVDEGDGDDDDGAADDTGAPASGQASLTRPAETASCASVPSPSVVLALGALRALRHRRRPASVGS